LLFNVEKIGLNIRVKWVDPQVKRVDQFIKRVNPFKLNPNPLTSYQIRESYQKLTALPKLTLFKDKYHNCKSDERSRVISKVFPIFNIKLQNEKA